MAVREYQLRASKKYQDKFDKVQIRVTHEEKEIIENNYNKTATSFKLLVAVLL